MGANMIHWNDAEEIRDDDGQGTGWWVIATDPYQVRYFDDDAAAMDETNWDAMLASFDEETSLTSVACNSDDPTMIDAMHAWQDRETRDRADKLSMENAARRGELVEVKAVAEVVNRAIGSMRGYVLGLTRLEEDERDEMLIKLGALYESAFNIQDGDEADVEPAAPVDGEPVGR
jgi:hypothetical protein